MATVTVCVPVYNAASFVAETLDSVAAQTFPDIKVLISLDRGNDESESVCRRHLTDRRFDLIVQPQRLGWVGNVNALIERVETEFFCIMPHDDLLDRRYLAELYAVASSDTGIACTYCDLSGFGSKRPRLVLRDVRGDALARVLELMLNHFGGVPFRGLVRRQHADDRPTLPTSLTDDFAADVAWILSIALRGELRRVPSTLYAKRYSDHTVHAAWRSFPRSKLVALWAELAACSVRIAYTRFSDPSDRELVLAAALMRVMERGEARQHLSPAATPWEQATMVSAFWKALGEFSLPDDLSSILASPQAEPLRRALAAAEDRNPLRSFARRFRRRLASGLLR